MTKKPAPYAGASTVFINGQSRSPGTMRFYSIAEIAEITGLSRRTVRRWIKSGELVAHHFGTIVRIAESDLNAFIVRHRDP
jgi:excisionase family DNA binding protein